MKDREAAGGVNRCWLGTRRADDFQECSVPLHNRVHRWRGYCRDLTLIHPRSIAGERVAARGKENAEADGQKASTLHPHTSSEMGRVESYRGASVPHPGAITEETTSATRIFPPIKARPKASSDRASGLPVRGSTRILLISFTCERVGLGGWLGRRPGRRASGFRGARRGATARHGGKRWVRWHIMDEFVREGGQWRAVATHEPTLNGP